MVPLLLLQGLIPAGRTPFVLAHTSQPGHAPGVGAAPRSSKTQSIRNFDVFRLRRGRIVSLFSLFFEKSPRAPSTLKPQFLLLSLCSK